jgi:hypothetical protein
MKLRLVNKVTFQSFKVSKFDIVGFQQNFTPLPQDGQQNFTPVPQDGQGDVSKFQSFKFQSFRFQSFRVSEFDFFQVQKFEI